MLPRASNSTPAAPKFKPSVLEVRPTANNTLSVLVNGATPPGIFGQPVNLPAATGPTSVAAIDFDLDGDLDLALTGGSADGMHYLLSNKQPADRAQRSLQVLVLDAHGHYTRAGAEVRLYAAGTTTLLGTQIVDTGSGYNSQNAMPVHFGLAKQEMVDVANHHPVSCVWYFYDVDEHWGGAVYLYVVLI